MSFSELTVSLILDEVEGKKDMGDELLLGMCRSLGYISRRVANYRKEISPSIELRVDIVHRNLGMYCCCFGGRRFFQELNARI